MNRCNQCTHLTPDEARGVCAFEDCPHKTMAADISVVTDEPTGNQDQGGDDSPNMASVVDAEAPITAKLGAKCKSVLTILKKAVKGKK